jgi:nickel/cobalt transporter (NicO) family protein
MSAPELSRPSGVTPWLTGLVLLAALLGLGAILLPETSGLIDGLREAQLAVHGQLTAAVKAVQGDPKAGLWLMTISFAYGILHAAGPGHGKVVIATYLGAGTASLRRGIALSCAAALAQGLTAIALVIVATSVLEMGFRDTQGSANGFEIASYAMVTALGLWLMIRAIRSVLALTRASAPDVEHHSHHHGHHHQHQHHVTDQSCEACGHAHGPSRADLERDGGWAAMAGVVTSIGLRPCTGAILVLLISEALELRWAGIASALSMAAGTALTVSAMAALTVHARGLAVRLLQGAPGQTSGLARHLPLLGQLPMLIGGLAIAVLGASLTWAALSTPAHPLF